MQAATAPVPGARLCVTEGLVAAGSDGRLSVTTPKMRAYVNGWTGPAIEAHFTYLGPTAELSPLASGEARRQFGLKLRAQDACNLVYAMWRIEPESKIVVSVKQNPGESTSSQCGNRGYQNIKPQRSVAPPILHRGDTHTLGAEFVGNDLHVYIDRREVWQGSLGAEASALQGQVGVRSDNIHLAFDLNVGAPVGIHPQFIRACRTGPDVSE
jgi:hypothetical protein